MYSSNEPPYPGDRKHNLYCLPDTLAPLHSFSILSQNLAKNPSFPTKMANYFI